MRRGAVLRDGVPAWVGPALVATIVLFDLRGFVFEPRLTNEHFDLLSFWLPRWTYLGREVADLALPAWNPYEMLGYRFAADPQGGWLYAPPMVLFSTLSPGVAMRAMVVLNPLLGGLAFFAFLRIEGLGRVAASVAAASLAAMATTSELVLSMPFAGTVGWTAVVLLAAAGFRRAQRRSSRIAWIALGAFGWSQVANAHLSHGLLMCTVLVAAFLLGHAAIDARELRRSWRAGALSTAVFLVVLPLASLAIIVPRFDAIEGSSLRDGYAALEEGTGERVIVGDSAIQPDGVWSAWPLASSSAPGAYAGAAVLLGAPLAFRTRGFRGLVIGFGTAFALTYVMTLTLVVTGPIGDLLDGLPFGDTLVHNPGRLRIVWLFVLPTLAAVGLQSLRDEPVSAPRLRRWFAAGVALWLVVPLAGRGYPVRWALFAAAVVPAIFAVRAWNRRTPWAPVALVGLLAVEIAVSSLWSSRYTGYTQYLGLEGESSLANAVLQPLQPPDVDLEAFLEPGPFVDVISDDRYLTWAPPAAYFQRGYLATQEPADWPALALERGTLFGVRDVLGYNPVQLQRYWTWIRAINELPLFYNATAVQYPTARDVDVMGVRYLIVPEGVPSPLEGEIVATDRGYDLVGLEGAPPMVSVVPSWRVVGGPEEAFEVVSDPAFRASDEAVVERTPAVGPPAPDAAAGTASYDEIGPAHVRISVEAATPSIVVIRNSYDDGWSATVDGEPAPVLPTDGFLQGVAVEAGSHEVLLVYEDRAVAVGLWLSGIVWASIAAAWAVARVHERRLGRAGGTEHAAPRREPDAVGVGEL